MKLESDTIAAVVDLYKTTPEFTTKIKSDKTRTQYRYQLSRLCDLEGVSEISLEELNTAKCQAIYWQLLNSVKGDGDGTRFANYTLQIVTRVWNVLMRYDLLIRNPWQFVERAKPEPRNTVWSSKDFRLFLETSFAEPKWRNIGLLVRINVELGQRIEDIRLAKWENFDLEDRLYRREIIEKTKERIPGIPLSDNLVKMLEQQKEVYDFQEWVVPHPFTLVPYKEGQISKGFRCIMSSADLPSRLQLRDIRRTVLTDLANSGATDTEIMAYSGHKNRESLNPYVRISTEQARNAAAKRNFDPKTFLKEEELT